MCKPAEGSLVLTHPPDGCHSVSREDLPVSWLQVPGAGAEGPRCRAGGGQRVLGAGAESPVSLGLV